MRRYAFGIIYAFANVIFVNILAHIFGVPTYEIYGPYVLGGLSIMFVDLYSKRSR